MYEGIVINEVKLLTNNIVFSLAALFMVALGVVAWLIFRNKENAKNRERMRDLQSRAETDPIAEKRLKRMQRKHKNSRRKTIVDEIVIFFLIAILFLVSLFVAVIPGWTDYIKKDYVVYSGEMKVVDDIRSSRIILQDGTVISGGFWLDEGKHCETIVYSKRTKVLVGIERG